MTPEFAASTEMLRLRMQTWLLGAYAPAREPGPPAPAAPPPAPEPRSEPRPVARRRRRKKGV